jgi:hypothetical protein
MNDLYNAQWALALPFRPSHISAARVKSSEEKLPASRIGLRRPALGADLPNENRLNRKCVTDLLQKNRRYHIYTQLFLSYSILLLAPILLRRLSESTVKMSSKMSLIVETGFDCYICDRALYILQTEQFLRKQSNFCANRSLYRKTY